MIVPLKKRHLKRNGTTVDMPAEFDPHYLETNGLMQIGGEPLDIARVVIAAFGSDRLCAAFIGDASHPCDRVLLTPMYRKNGFWDYLAEATGPEKASPIKRSIRNYWFPPFEREFKSVEKNDCKIFIPIPYNAIRKHKNFLEKVENYASCATITRNLNLDPRACEFRRFRTRPF